MKGRHPITLRGVDVGAAAEQRPHALDIASHRGVGDGSIGRLAPQTITDVVNAPISSHDNTNAMVCERLPISISPAPDVRALRDASSPAP